MRKHEEARGSVQTKKWSQPWNDPQPQNDPHFFFRIDPERIPN